MRSGEICDINQGVDDDSFGLKGICLPAAIVGEYGDIIAFNPLFVEYFSDPLSGQTLEHVCGKQFFTQIIYLIQFAQEYDKSLLFKDNFMVLDGVDSDNDIVYDLSLLRYKIEGAKAQHYLMTLNPRAKNEVENTVYTHDQRLQTLGHFSGAIAHDFNNILMVISGLTESLLQQVNSHNIDRSVLQDGLSNTLNNIDKAGDLVSRLLAFARKQVLNFETINMQDKLVELQILIQSLVGSEMELSYDIKQNLHDIDVDPVQFEQIILNLVLNAKQAIISFKPCHGHAKINISAQNIEIRDSILFNRGYFNPSSDNIIESGKYLQIKIQDNGCGIKQSVVHRIFDPFFSTKSEKNGTGLGLSTAFGIIKQSKGHLLLKSIEGEGAEFIIIFPRSRGSKFPYKRVQKLSNCAAISSGQGIEKYGKNQRVLLVEDEDNIRKLLQQGLNDHGYQTLCFSTANAARSYMLQNQDFAFDLLLTDVIMPGMSGAEFVQFVRSHIPDIKVLFISGYSAEVLDKALKSKESFEFMSKPFKVKELLSVVDRLMVSIA